MFLLIPLKFGKSQFLANLVIADAQLLNLLVRYKMCIRDSYEVDRGSLIKSSQANPILNALYQKITPEEAHHLLHVHYPGEDAQA